MTPAAFTRVLWQLLQLAVNDHATVARWTTPKGTTP